MKGVKLFLAAVAMTFAMGANAQFFNGKFTASVSGGAYSPGSVGAWNIGVGYQKPITKTRLIEGFEFIKNTFLPCKLIFSEKDFEDFDSDMQ